MNDTEQVTVPKIGETGKWIQGVMTYRDLWADIAGDSGVRVGKPELQLTNCWRLIMGKAESFKCQGDPGIKGAPTILWDLFPGAWLGSHNNYQRK